MCTAKRGVSRRSPTPAPHRVRLALHLLLFRVTAMTLSRGIAALLLCAAPALAQSPLSHWAQHSTERPRPSKVEPGAPFSVAPPRDAIVLFDGTSLDRWTHVEAKTPLWKVADGAFEVVPRTEALVTRDSFGDVQLHIEWASPRTPGRGGQNSGNSGVFFGDGRYEVQVLDSYTNDTYPDGQAGALYGQFPPLVNASRAPGEWQSYDIVYHRPRFNADGSLKSAARFTVLHNGVLVQDNMELVGPTANGSRPPFEMHPDRLPISLQDHGHPVRFRNVWLRDLEAIR
jgi:hypothetical protein